MVSVSIIIPVYNSRITICESIDSVIRECDLNSYCWELIIIDDGSTDNSVEIIRDYISKSIYSENIQLIEQLNGGAAVARNTGLRLSKGQFVAFNDSDDRWLPGKLFIQMQYLIENEDVVMVAGIYANDKISTIKKQENSMIIGIKDQVIKNYFSPQTTTIRRSILSKSGLFCETMRYAEEGFFFNNIVYYGKCVLLTQSVAEPIINKERWGDCGLSGNLVKMELGELFNIHSAYRLKYISLPKYLFAVCFSIVKFLRRWLISKFRKLCR